MTQFLVTQTDTTPCLISIKVMQQGQVLGVIKLTGLGATWVDYLVPDRQGKISSIMLGFASAADYAGEHPYFGSIVGRYAGRIGEATFTLGNDHYRLPKNDNGHCLHGGPDGFHHQTFTTDFRVGADECQVIFSLHSPHGAAGFPGAVDLQVVYRIDAQAAVTIDYTATVDRPTILNLTNHAYFNLKDAGNSSILDHELMLNAAHYVDMDAEGIARRVLPVDAPLDFTRYKKIGQDIEHLTASRGGYDHCFILDTTDTTAACIREPVSGRQLTVTTNQPAIVFYSGNFLDSSDAGRGLAPYAYRHGFCLETQHPIDSANHPYLSQKPAGTVLGAGETYCYWVCYTPAVTD